MGIVKKALETKQEQQYQVSRLKLGGGRVVVGKGVAGLAGVGILALLALLSSDKK